MYALYRTDAAIIGITRCTDAAPAPAPAVGATMVPLVLVLLLLFHISCPMKSCRLMLTITDPACLARRVVVVVVLLTREGPVHLGDHSKEALQAPRREEVATPPAERA